MRNEISTPKAPRAIGPYSQAVVAGGFVFTSGQIPIDPATGEMISGSIEEQTHRVFANLQAVLEAAGTSLHNAVKVTVYLQSLEDFKRVNEVYAEVFGEVRPARSTVEVAGLPLGSRVEVDVVATC